MNWNSRGRNPKKGDAYLRQRKLVRYRFIDTEKQNYPLKILCRVMEVSPSGYYAWRKRLTKPPNLRRLNLKQLVRNCYFENRKRYGARRIAKALRKSGVKIGRRRARFLMREENLKAIQARAFKPHTTDSKRTRAADNLLAQDLPPESVADRIIIGTITYIHLRGGKSCYLAMWRDRLTRRIIGWRLSDETTAEPVISALEKAIRKRKLKPGAIIHSDRGSRYASNAFRELLKKNGFRQSMAGKGGSCDNAQAESFFSRFKAELIENGVFEDINQARLEIFSYIEGYYNLRRLHSSPGYKSPMEFEMESENKNGGIKRQFFIH